MRNNTLPQVVDGTIMYDPMTGLSGYARRLWLDHPNLSKSHVKEAARLEATLATNQMTAIQLAKVYAAHRGISSREGGWIYDEADRPIVQGWQAYADRLVSRRRIRVGHGINWSL